MVVTCAIEYIVDAQKEVQMFFLSNVIFWISKRTLLMLHFPTALFVMSSGVSTRDTQPAQTICVHKRYSVLGYYALFIGNFLTFRPSLLYPFSGQCIMRVS